MRKIWLAVLATFLLLVPQRVYSQERSYDSDQLICLTNNIYFEARGESDLGKVAVGYVTINRTNSGIYPTAICDVVYQKVKHTCQFTWACNRHAVIRNWQAWINCYYAAIDVVMKKEDDPTHGSLYFHVGHKTSAKQIQIGHHIFHA